MDSYVLTFQIFLCSYACTYGLEDKRGQDEMKCRYAFVKKRGCQCHFIIKFMVQILEISIITYNMYEQVDSQGWPCHGQHDTSGHARSLHQSKLSRDMISYVESHFFLEVPVDSFTNCMLKKFVDMDAAT